MPFDSDNEVSPYSLSPLSNKRYDVSHLCTLSRQSAETVLSAHVGFPVPSLCFCSHKLLRSPRKPARKISKIPFKVLDAPELQDDFYLNLVDWSAGNLLSVGLGSCVYLWSACTSQVRGGTYNTFIYSGSYKEEFLLSLKGKQHSLCLICLREKSQCYMSVDALCVPTGDEAM